VLDETGRLLVGRGENRAVAPASVQKLIVGSVALATLGPAFHFHTLLTGRDYPDANGVLDGDLYFVGSGDPSFRSDALDRGVAQLAREGIKHVNGVVVDTSAFRGPEINPHWDADDATEDYAAPTSPVSLDGDTVEFHVIGTSPGSAARVTFFPAATSSRRPAASSPVRAAKTTSRSEARRRRTRSAFPARFRPAWKKSFGCRSTAFRDTSERCSTAC